MEPIVLGKKRRLSEENDYSKCVICQRRSDDQGPLNTLTNRGYDTFREAVKIRKDEVHDRLWNDLQNKDEFLSRPPLCHRNCRSDYTHKKHLEALNTSELSKEQTENNNKESRGARNKAIDYKQCCFLCEKDRDVKGTRTMMLVSTLQRQKSIHEKAKELNDDNVLLKIMGYGDQCIDMIANDFRYHTRCLNVFMNRRSKCKNPDTNSCSDVSDVVFQKLISEISDCLIKDGHAYLICQLNKRYMLLLAEHGITDSTHRVEKLSKKLLNHFGNTVQIVHLQDKRSLICASSLSVKDMCEQVIDLQSELSDSFIDHVNVRDTVDNCNLSSSSYLVAKGIRKNVKVLERELGHSENEHLDLSYEGACSRVDVDLYNFIAWLITDADECIGTDGRVILSSLDKESVLNIAQDVTWHISKQPLPKHIGIAIHILKQTRCKQLVTILNRFGNCVSYNTAQRYINTVAKKVNEQEKRDGIFIPMNLMQGHFTQYALDNLNFHSEGQDGGSLDATSHNIYQYINHDEEATQSVNVSIHKTRKVKLDNTETFVPNESKLTLKDRRDARSLSGIEIKEGDRKRQIPLDSNIVWYLLRMFPTNLMTEEEEVSVSIPTWNKFFELTTDQECPKTLIGYGPLFPQTPTKPDVVQTSLDYFVSVNQKMGQRTTVVTCDQAIYDIVKGLVRKNPTKYSDVVVRLGGFHIAQNFLGAIGFFVKESGIEDILSLCDICGRGTAKKVMSGKDYYKMVRFHSWVCEAFFMLMWESFENWISAKNDCEKVSHLSIALQALRKGCEKHDTTMFKIQVNDIITQLATIEELWMEFQKTVGTTAKLWIMYIEMVQILKRYILAERCGYWEEHIQETENMIPYIVSSGHTKYMSCLPIYVDEMKKLPETFPDVYREFREGHFTVHKIKGKLNGVWTDMALEQTYNKEGKNTLFTGITQSECVREKYIKTIPFMTSVSEVVKTMVNIDSSRSDHHDKMNKEDLDIVLKIKEKVRCDLINPFESNPHTDNQLINIVTGETLFPTELIKAKEIGLEAIAAAMTESLDKIKTPKITTFANRKKPAGKKPDSVRHILQEESTVTRALCFTQELSDEARIEAFSYEWMAYPPSLFQPDPMCEGKYQMRKGTKSNFFKILQKEAGSVSSNELPISSDDTLYVIDAMAFIQRFQTLGAKTFGELRSKYLKKVLNMKPAGCCVVHFIGDRYNMGTNSLKRDERHRRDKGVMASEYVLTDNASIPDWSEFLANPKNKESLLNYLASSWAIICNELPERFELVITADINAYRLTSTGADKLEEMSCPLHEEADTRIFTHIASCKSPRVVIHATDTDIFILSMYYLPRLEPVKEIWIENDKDYIPIHETVYKLATHIQKNSLDMTNTLLCVYVLTGCDSVSYPFKRGKNKAAKVALEFVNRLPLLCNFGFCDHVTEDIVSEAREIFCTLYGKPTFTSLNKLRAHLFASSRRDLRSLPPTEDAFKLHLLRSLCQINLYKQASLTKPHILNPVDYGRHINEGILLPTMMTKPEKPSCANLIYCKCKKAPKCKRNCPCLKASVQCIIACSCCGDPGICDRLRQDSSDTDDE